MNLFLIICMLLANIPIHAVERPIIYEPEFSKKSWQGRTMAVAPVIIAPEITLSGPAIDQQIRVLLSNPKLPFHFGNYRFLSDPGYAPSTAVQADLNRIGTRVLESQEYDTSSALGICRAMKLDRLFLITITRLTRSGSVLEGRSFSATMSGAILDADGRVLLTAFATGNAADFESRPHSSTLGLSPAKDSDAVLEALHALLQSINENFPGEAISGDCLDGTGLFIFYDGAPALNENSRRYEGEWSSGMAHGDGAIIEHVGPGKKQIIRTHGQWYQGNRISEGVIEHFRNGKWKRIPLEAVNRIKNGMSE